MKNKFYLFEENGIVKSSLNPKKEEVKENFINVSNWSPQKILNFIENKEV